MAITVCSLVNGGQLSIPRTANITGFPHYDFMTAKALSDWAGGRSSAPK